jgi:hypothetical protein
MGRIFCTVDGKMGVSVVEVGRKGFPPGTRSVTEEGMCRWLPVAEWVRLYGGTLPPEPRRAGGSGKRPGKRFSDDYNSRVNTHESDDDD